MKNQHDPRNGTAINRKSVIGLGIAAVGLLAVIALLSDTQPGAPAVTVAEVVADVKGNVVRWRGENRSGSSCEASPSGTMHGESDTIPPGPFEVATPLDEGATVGHASIRIRCGEDTRVLAREVSTVPCLEDDCPNRTPMVRITIDPTQFTAQVKTVFDTKFAKSVADKGYRVVGPVRSRLSLSEEGRAVWFNYDILEANVADIVECDMSGFINGKIGQARDGELLSVQTISAYLDTNGTWKPGCWLRDVFEEGFFSSQAHRSLAGALRSLPEQIFMHGVGGAVKQLTGDRTIGEQMAARMVRGGLVSSVSMPRPGVVDVIVWQEQEDHGATRHGPHVADMPTVWPVNGSAGTVTVSYSLINQLLEMLLAERPFRQIAGNRQGSEASSLNAAGQVIREWLAEANRSEWRKIANVNFLEDLDFRAPLAVFPEGDDRIRVFVKGIALFEDASEGTDAPMRYELWAEGRSSLACPGPAVSSIDDGDKEYLRQRLTMQPSSDSGERATRLGMTAGAWLREDSNSLIPTAEFRPLEELTRAFSGVCLDLSQPVRMGGSSSLLLTAVSIGNVAGGAIQVQFSRSAG